MTAQRGFGRMSDWVCAKWGWTGHAPQVLLRLPRVRLGVCRVPWLAGRGAWVLLRVLRVLPVRLGGLLGEGHGG